MGPAGGAARAADSSVYDEISHMIKDKVLEMKEGLCVEGWVVNVGGAGASRTDDRPAA